MRKEREYLLRQVRIFASKKNMRLRRIPITRPLRGHPLPEDGLTGVAFGDDSCFNQREALDDGARRRRV